MLRIADPGVLVGGLRVAATSVLLAMAVSCGGEPVSYPFNGEQALAYAGQQMGFGPRVPNSQAHRRTGDWIIEHLTTRADTVQVQAFEHPAADGTVLALRNIFARFNLAATDRILILAHWDSRPVAEKDPNLLNRERPTPGANDGASGVAILLELANELALAPPAIGIDLLFVDAEDYGDFASGADVLIGSSYFAENLPEGYNPRFALLLDMVGDADLEILREGYSANRAATVTAQVWARAAELGLEDEFVDRVGQPIVDDHLPLLDAGIPAIAVIDLDYVSKDGVNYHHTQHDTLDKLSALSLAKVGTLVLSLVRDPPATGSAP